MKGFLKTFKKPQGYLVVALASLLVAVLIAAFAGPTAWAAEHWKQKYTRFSGVAGETLATGDVACIQASTGNVFKADANDSDKRPAVGIIGKGGASAATVEIVVSGVLAGQTAVSPGAKLHLSETAGAIAAAAPTNEQILGWGMPNSGSASTTSYFINVIPPVSAGAGY